MDRKTARKAAEKLVEQMTVEERASQLRYDAPGIPRLGIPAYNWWNEALHGVARAGTATVFPQAIGLAAAFDCQMQKEIGGVISHEGRSKYNAQKSYGDRDIYKGLTFWCPNVNIFRDPRWGRGQETYGEDPYLTSSLAVQFIKGIQGNGKYMKAAACAKHFAVHSGPESLRHEFDARVSKKDMYETYLPAFEAAVKEAGVESVMGAYNRTNGEPCCGSKTLLADILRGEWGFEGHVVSDCWAIQDFHEHHRITATAPESAALAIKNGCDLNCGITYLHLLQALKDGLITEEDITRACVRLFTTRYLLGLFADDCEYDNIPLTDNDCDEHDRLAQRAAEESFVLLENNGILPLDADKIHTVAVIGPTADSISALEGNYQGRSSRYVTLLEGIREYCNKRGIRVLFGEGSHLYKSRLCGMLDDDRAAEAAAIAAEADVTIACVGMTAELEGEEGAADAEFGNGDRVTLCLPKCQQNLMKAISKAAKKLVTVITTGSSVYIPEGDAKLLVWYPGQRGGTALARMLFGEVSPGGVLPVTFYRDVADLPDFNDYSLTGRTYRYFKGQALYPFGFGLSYTKFEVSDAALNDYEITVNVHNKGNRDGSAVLQVYVKNDSPLAPPNAKLSGFSRVNLSKNESKSVKIDLDKYAFAETDENGRRIPVPHSRLYVGLCQPDETSVRLSGIKPLEINR